MASVDKIGNEDLAWNREDDKSCVDVGGKLLVRTTEVIPVSTLARELEVKVMLPTGTVLPGDDSSLVLIDDTIVLMAFADDDVTSEDAIIADDRR